MSQGVLDILVNAALNPVQTSSFIALRRLHERADVLRSRSVNVTHEPLSNDSIIRGDHVPFAFRTTEQHCVSNAGAAASVEHW